MDKFSFIKNVLESNKLGVNQKERFFKLVSKELVESGGSTKKQITEYEYPKIHKAPELVDLMRWFSDNDRALKYTTHSWEHGAFPSYQAFMKDIQKEWNQLKPKLFTLNERLASKIQQFLFNPNLGKKSPIDFKVFVWGEKKLKFGWSSQTLKSHMKIEDADPFACKIPNDTIKQEKIEQLHTFEDYVNQFKNEIEVREDNSTLVTIINNLWEEIIGFDTFVVEQENTEGISFLTDVPYLKSTLKIIFRSFKKEENSPLIKVVLKEYFDEKYLELKITQHGRTCKRSVKDPKISNPTTGDFSTIIKNLKNLADFSVESFFKDEKVYRINYLSSNSETLHVENLPDTYECNGFTYILKFYL